MIWLKISSLRHLKILKNGMKQEKIKLIKLSEFVI